MANTKVIAIVAALVVVVAGAGAFLVLNKGGSDKETITQTGRLMVLGNANDDDVIDSHDIDTIKDIISTGTWDKSVYPYADANNDGSINDDDVKYVEKIIDKSVKYVYYVNSDGEVKSAHYPIDKYVAVGSFAINAMIVLSKEKCYGVSGSKTFKDEVYWTGIQDKTKISDNAKKADYELVTQIEGIQSIFTSDISSNIEQFEVADIDVIILDFNNINELAAIMIMGFLIDEKDKYLAVAAAYDEVFNKVKQIREAHPELADTKALHVYNNGGINSDQGAQGWISSFLGMPNSWKFDPALDQKNALNVTAGDSEWYLNERFKPDYIICLNNYTYSKTSTPDALLNTLNTYLYKMDAYPDKIVVINSSIPLLGKLAYLIEGMFPDEVEKGYGNKIMQSYIDTFNPDFAATGYKFADDGLFLITTKEIQQYAQEHPMS